MLRNLTPVQFKQLQEIAKHGLGLHTMFRELLSEHPKNKVKPSSFQKFANANNSEEVIQALRSEKEAHSDPSSETHIGGGIRDAFNAVGGWAFDVSNLGNMSWTLDQLDLKSTKTNTSAFKDFTNHEHAAGFLSTLNPEQYGTIQKTAAHFGGQMRSREMPSKPARKIKRKTWNVIAGADTPHKLGMELAKQKSHLGGGILDGINAAISTIWYYTPFNVAYDWIKDKRGLSDIKTKMSDLQKWNADTLEEAYKQEGSRDATISNGWEHVPQYDGEYTSVYRNPEDNSLHVAIRGSVTMKDWAFHDTLLMARNKPGADETERIQQFLIQVAKENPDANITVNSHSLSGSFVQNAFTEATPEESEWLDHYGVINLYNPGSNAFANMDDIKEFVGDDRVHLFLNRTDTISTAYAQAITDENKDRVIFGNATYNPLGSHTFSQWQSDEPTPEPTPESDMGGQKPQYDYRTADGEPQQPPTEEDPPDTWIDSILHTAVGAGIGYGVSLIKDSLTEEVEEVVGEEAAGWIVDILGAGLMAL